MGRAKAVAISALCAVSLAACAPSADGKLVAACEEVLKGRLLSPSGYARISWSASDRPMSSEEYRDRYVAVRGSSIPVDISIAGTVDHTLNSGVLEYDAPNQYGALIRHSATCDLDTSDPRDFDLSSAKYNVQVNGLSQRAWLRAVERSVKYGAPLPGL